MNDIRQGAKEQRLVRIKYLDAKGMFTIRTVEPYEIKDGKLYGWCTQKHAIRAFKLDHIQSTEVTELKFTPRFPILIE